MSSIKRSIEVHAALTSIFTLHGESWRATATAAQCIAGNPKPEVCAPPLQNLPGHEDTNAKQSATSLMQVDQTLIIGGWVKTGREAGGGKWIFLEVNDGTSFQSLQVTP